MSLSGGKRKPIREAYADRRVRERCQTRETKKRRLSSSLTTDLLLLLRGLLRLLLRWHQWITSSWPRIEGYIDTLTLQMSTRDPSDIRRWRVVPRLGAARRRASEAPRGRHRRSRSRGSPSGTAPGTR